LEFNLERNKAYF